MKNELVRNRFDPDRIEIHPPVPPPGDNPLPSTFSNRNLIIYAGQILRGKGVDVLLESLARIQAPFSLSCSRRGRIHRQFCEKLSHKLGLNDRVHFKGYVPPAELGLFYREASVAVVEFGLA